VSTIELCSGLGVVEKFELIKQPVEIRDGPGVADRVIKNEELLRTARCIICVTGEVKELANEGELLVN
jgi:hypothetical protein